MNLWPKKLPSQNTDSIIINQRELIRVQLIHNLSFVPTKLAQVRWNLSWKYINGGDYPLHRLCYLLNAQTP